MKIIVSLLFAAAVLVSADHNGSKREAKRQFEIGGRVDTDDNGRTSAGADVAYSWNDGKTRLGGQVDYSKPGGKNFGATFNHDTGSGPKIGVHVDDHSAGLEASKTWNNGNTRFGSYVNHDFKGDTGAGLRFSHRWRRNLHSNMKRAPEKGGHRDLHSIKRAPEVGGYANRDNNGRNNAGVDASHSWNHGNTEVRGHVDHSWGGGGSKHTSGGVGFRHKWKRDLHGNVKRTPEVGGYANTESNGRNNAGVDASHSWNNGNTEVRGQVDHSWGGGGSKHTSGGVSFRHKWKRDLHGNVKRAPETGGHYDRDNNDRNNAGVDVSHSWNNGNTRLGGYVDHSWGGGVRKDTSAGVRFSHRFRRAQQTKISPDSESDNDQTGSSSCWHHVSHIWNDGRTKAEGHVKHDSNGGTGFGGSFLHKWRRDLDMARRAPTEEDEPEEETTE